MSFHVRTPGELIASLPVLLGFVPFDSVVVVGMETSGRVAPVVRLDRSDCLIPELAQSVATAVVGHLARARATAVVLVSFRQSGGPLECAALDALRPLIGAHVDVADAWVVADGRFRAPECPDRGCCPDGGRAVPAAPVGIPTYGSRKAVAHGSREIRSALASGESRKRARSAFNRASRARAIAQIGPQETGLTGLCGGRPDPGNSERREALARWRRRRLDVWRAALAEAARGTFPSDAETGKLAAGLCDIVVRDAAVISMVPGRSVVANALCDDPSAPGVREALSVMIAAEAAVRPRDTDIAAVVALAEHVASLSDEGAAPALTLAGLALWWSGDDSSAGHAIVGALAAQPGYRLAELVACALEARMPPGWIAAA